MPEKLTEPREIILRWIAANIVSTALIGIVYLVFPYQIMFPTMIAASVLTIVIGFAQ